MKPFEWLEIESQSTRKSGKRRFIRPQVVVLGVCQQVAAKDFTTNLPA